MENLKLVLEVQAFIGDKNVWEHPDEDMDAIETIAWISNDGLGWPVEYNDERELNIHVRLTIVTDNGTVELYDFHGYLVEDEDWSLRLYERLSYHLNAPEGSLTTYPTQEQLPAVLEKAVKANFEERLREFLKAIPETGRNATEALVRAQNGELGKKPESEEVLS